VSNFAASAQTVTVELPFATVATSGTVKLLTGAATASNTPAAPNTIVPTTKTIITSKTFSWSAPALSVAVITVVAH
ncbi:glycoside hydrolase family 51 protein, partial [Athelia psychrophila]